MKLGFRGRRFGVRLAIILSISLFVVLIQIISVSRLNTPTKYPWEDLLANEKEDIERRSLKTALEVNIIIYCFLIIVMYTKLIITFLQTNCWHAYDNQSC